ncbi:MAG: 4-oxalocrotonate tautomerase family protein [Sporichthyaceae bacterium]|nr:4-oxalocrotonate tautomerase family protein [Sporichthyaceae bacterium]
MPLVQVTLMEGAVSPAEKAQLITGITSATAGVLGEDIRRHTWVVVDEIPSGGWGMGGHPITREAVVAMRSGALL